MVYRLSGFGVTWRVSAAHMTSCEHGIREIRWCLAGDERIAGTVGYIYQLIGEVRRSGQKVLCMLTGVPGAGKTIACLQIAHLEEALQSDWRTVFITGNGPLLKVLRAALQRDYASRQSVPLLKAKTHAESLLQSVHAYIGETRSGNGPPIERSRDARRDGEAGRMAERPRTQVVPWQLVCSPIVGELGAVRSQSSVRIADDLHLALPIRAHRAQGHAL